MGADLLKLFEYVMGKSKNRVIANRVLKKEYEIESLNLRVKYDGVELPLFNFEKSTKSVKNMNYYSFVSIFK